MGPNDIRGVIAAIVTPEERDGIRAALGELGYSVI